MAGNSFRSHVVRCSDECVCVAFCAELAADSKIAELDLPVSAEENVAGFDVSVDNFLAVEVCEAV